MPDMPADRTRDQLTACIKWSNWPSLLGLISCLVHVVSGEANCPAPEADEVHTLARVGAPTSVRLACQLRPRGDIAVVPLLAAAPATLLLGSVRNSVERAIVVMLVD